MTKDTTLVVGGGLTGLAAAVGAAQRGERVIVLERGAVAHLQYRQQQA